MLRPSSSLYMFAEESAKAATGDNPRDCPTFFARPMVFDVSGLENPDATPSGKLRRLEGPILRITNVSKTPVKAGEVYLAIQTSDEQWVRVDGAGTGTGTIIEFEITRVGDYPDPVAGYGEGELCSQKGAGPGDEPVYAKILRNPCGQEVIPDTEIVLKDNHRFFEGRSESQLIGKIGLATLLTPTPEEIADAEANELPLPECSYVVVWINWFRWREVVVDVYWNGTDIEVEKERVWVWDHCILPNEIIAFGDCPDPPDGPTTQ